VTTAPGYADVAVQLKHALLGRAAYITFGCNPSGTDVPTMAANVNISINAAGSLKTMFDSSVSFGTITVRYGVESAEDQVSVFPSAVVGTLVQASVPPNVALLVYKRTARGGRRGRGRLFLPWAPSVNAVNEDGTIVTSYMTTAQTALETFRAALITNDMPMVVLHKPSQPGTQHPTTQGAPDPVTALNPSGLISTQRRRLGRR
jgi:hypothetical protein